ncbi:MAG: hypothetical protein KIT14_06605 [bacterium]|nr:hypothetical protein [bacterium]
MTVRWKTFVGAAVVAALVMGPVAAGPALAKKKKKESMKASLSAGGKFNGQKKFLFAVYSAPGNVVTLSGTSIKRRGRSVLTRILNMGCSADIKGPLPVTVGCASQYAETGFKGRTVIDKGWGGEGLSVTFTSYDGTRVTGTFSGTLVANNGGLAPLTFSNGSFSLILDAQ